jgi:hypothetical protein
MKDLTTISSDLFNKIRSRFSDIKIGDEKGALTTDPTHARFFDVNYSVDGEDLGRVNIKIDDDSLTVIYNNAMTDNQAESVKDRWYSFLKELRQFARKNLLTFDTRDITKSNLEKRDYKYLAQGTGDTSMSESKLFGTSKTSYQDMGEAKIIVKHSKPVNYNNPAGRTQRIESIYIESANGERYRYPVNHLNGARAMARHVANGGTSYDAIGSYISGLSEELNKLRQFKNYTQRSGVMAEALGDISERVIERIANIKNEVAHLQRQSFYETFKEEFQISETTEVPEETMNTWVDALTIKTFNEELKSVFPYIYKLVSEKREDEVTYEDIISEEDECADCGNNPCSCDDEVTEHNHLADFEQHLENLSTFEYERVSAPEESVEEESTEEVSNGQQSTSISEEVLEFITSMYDPQAKSFPRGEEGVKIAVEKKFGEHAARFAHYVVEKLSGTPAQEDLVGEDAEFGAYWYEQLAQKLFDISPNLDSSGRAEEVINAGYEIAKQEVGEKRASYDFSYDQDFPSDFVSAYAYLQKGGDTAEAESEAVQSSVELEAIRKLAGM